MWRPLFHIFIAWQARWNVFSVLWHPAGNVWKRGGKTQEAIGRTIYHVREDQSDLLLSNTGHVCSHMIPLPFGAMHF